MGAEAEQARTRGHRKKERTRRELVAAGLRVLAEKGQALTVSDVVAEAGASNGTFYNYFVDRHELLDALAEHSALGLAAASAQEEIADPARRFAAATARVLVHAQRNETWARVMLRLASRPGTGVELSRYLREDLAEGLAAGRFDCGPEPAALDQVAGLILMTMRRMVAGDVNERTAEHAIERGLRAVGVEATEAAELAAEAMRSLEDAA